MHECRRSQATERSEGVPVVRLKVTGQWKATEQSEGVPLGRVPVVRATADLWYVQDVLIK